MYDYTDGQTIRALIATQPSSLLAQTCSSKQSSHFAQSHQVHPSTVGSLRLVGRDTLEQILALLLFCPDVSTQSAAAAEDGRRVHAALPVSARNT